MMFGRLTVFLIFVLVLPACTTASNPFALSPDIKSAFNEEPEINFLKQNPKRAYREESRLTLFFSNGKNVALRDNREEDCEDMPEGEIGPCYIAYRVIGYWHSRDLFLLDILYYEGSSAALVKNDGSIEYIPGRPEFSYDAHRFAAFSEDCFFESASSVSVSDFVDEQIVEFFFDTTGDGIGIDSIRWLNRNRLSVRLFDCRDGYDTTARWQAFLQKRRDNSWMWEGNSTEIPKGTSK